MGYAGKFNCDVCSTTNMESSILLGASLTTHVKFCALGSYSAFLPKRWIVYCCA